MAEIQDEDNFPNDFDGLDFDNIPGLQAPIINKEAPEISVPGLTVQQDIMPFTAASPVPSVGSSNVEDIDSAFLAAVDALEARALREMVRGGLPTDDKDGTNGLNHSHENFMKFRGSSSMNRKGKRKADPREDMDVRAILAGYEAELTCPICCDLLVGAQVANPCGHTCCGECGYGWLAQNKYEPTCAVCRTNLCTRTPLLPNFAVDSFVRQHVHTLATSGYPEWQERGYRTIEWNKRVESWKKQADDRAAKKKLKETTRSRRRQSRYLDAEDYPYVPPWIIDGGVEDNEPLVARVAVRRGTRSRRYI